jgi:hypothetical protein
MPSVDRGTNGKQVPGEDESQRLVEVRGKRDPFLVCGRTWGGKRARGVCGKVGAHAMGSRGGDGMRPLERVSEASDSVRLDPARPVANPVLDLRFCAALPSAVCVLDQISVRMRARSWLVSLLFGTPLRADC